MIVCKEGFLDVSITEGFRSVVSFSVLSLALTSSCGSVGRLQGVVNGPWSRIQQNAREQN